jgi:hypothetical protein
MFGKVLKSCCYLMVEFLLGWDGSQWCNNIWNLKNKITECIWNFLKKTFKYPSIFFFVTYKNGIPIIISIWRLLIEKFRNLAIGKPPKNTHLSHSSEKFAKKRKNEVPICVGYIVTQLWAPFPCLLPCFFL